VSMLVALTVFLGGVIVGMYLLGSDDKHRDCDVCASVGLSPHRPAYLRDKWE
jgi:hypothetical protein